MDHSDQRQQQQQQQQGVGDLPGNGQMPYGDAYQQSSMVGTGTPAAAPPSPPQQQLAYHQPGQHLHSPRQQQQLQAFWANQNQEVEQASDFKNHSLPLARIKKIMKADEDVRMISSEAPVIFAKACEMFILELTLRSWIHTEENKRRTLQRNDIAAAISRTDVFDFLVDIIPRDDLKEDGLGVNKAGIPLVGSPPDALQYYFMPPQHTAGVGAAMYGGGQQPRPPAFMPWAQAPTQGQQLPSLHQPE